VTGNHPVFLNLKRMHPFSLTIHGIILHGTHTSNIYEVKNTDWKYPAVLAVILGGIAAYGIITYQWLMAVVLILLCLFSVAVIYLVKGLESTHSEKKKFIVLVVALAVTVYSFLSSQWLVWGVVIVLLVADYEIMEFRRWMDERQERYLSAMREMNAERNRAPPEHP